MNCIEKSSFSNQVKIQTLQWKRVLEECSLGECHSAHLNETFPVDVLVHVVFSWDIPLAQHTHRCTQLWCDLTAGRDRMWVQDVWQCCQVAAGRHKTMEASKEMIVSNAKIIALMRELQQRQSMNTSQKQQRNLGASISQMRILTQVPQDGCSAT